MHHVQPIVIDRNAKHEETVAAAAAASLAAYDENHPDQFKEWLSGRFAKTVRRAKSSAFAKTACLPGATVVEVGDGKAVALAPMPYADFPKELSKLQVSGTDLPRSGRYPEVPAPDVLLVVNGDLNMTTGKEAAQVAHALWIAYLAGWCTTRGTFQIVRVSDNDFTGYAQTQHARVVTDSGLTELTGPTQTVVALPGPHKERKNA